MRRASTIPEGSSRSRLGVLEGIAQGLAGTRNGLRDAPAIVVLAKSGGGCVVHIAGVERGADFVEWSPLPGEVDIGSIALFADAGDSEQFAARDRDGKGRF